ncbi:MAG: hypothetical protein H6835_02115 [Planctomycetes bacterium]|nr:hypothetical protein [Planctomycetota bacterium]
MRRTLLLAPALLLLAGCATSDADAWRDLQRARLNKLHGQRSPEQALHAVLEAAPAPLLPVPPLHEPTATPSQSPQHIDQRMPRHERGPRPMREVWQPLDATVDVGTGTVAVHASGSRLDDRTDAHFLRARLDAGNGAALHVDLWDSTGDLFAGVLVSDGTTPVRADAELSGFDVFPHLRLDRRLGDLYLPVRIGAFTDWQQLEHQASTLTRRWLGIGPRVMFEPTLRLAEGDDGRLELFGRVGGDVGIAWFEDDFRNGQDRDSTLRWSGELGAGVRGRFGRLRTELGYRVVDTTFGRLHTDLYGDRHRTGIERQQFYIGFGVTY